MSNKAGSSITLNRLIAGTGSLSLNGGIVRILANNYTMKLVWKINSLVHLYFWDILFLSH